MKISPLPWGICKASEDCPTQITDANNNVAGSSEDRRYVVDVANAFPEVIEALRMVLHDPNTYEAMDKAEQIMSHAYGIMHRYEIKAPRFFAKE